MSEQISYPEIAWELWQRVRSSKPLVQCITNYVSMEIMAATLLATGASPAMVRLRRYRGRMCLLMRLPRVDVALGSVPVKSWRAG